MKLPKLTPLQSRFAACLGTSIVLLIIYFSLNPSHFAYAAELDSILGEDHNHHRIALGREFSLAGDLDWGDGGLDYDSDGTADYQADFAGISRSIIGRAPLDTVGLKNNLPNTLNIDAGQTQYYIFEKDEVFSMPGTRGSQLPTNVTGDTALLKMKRSLLDDGSESLEEQDSILIKRQDGGVTVYVSANTCLQPVLNENKTGTPGQLTIYYSLDDNNQNPTAEDNDGSFQLDQGYGATEIPSVSGNLYISISAPDLPNDTFTGPWSYQIAASADDYYHYYNNETSFLWTVDTDSNSALLMTYNLTDQDGSDPAVIQQRQEWMDMEPPFSIYVFNSSSPKIDGIKQSYCGLSKLNMEFMRINTSMSERGVGSNPKQQFYVESLLPGNTYFSVLAYGGGNTSGNPAIIGGGGQVWKSLQFSTKSGPSLPQLSLSLALSRSHTHTHTHTYIYILI
jgi:calcium channel MID1